MKKVLFLFLFVTFSSIAQIIKIQNNEVQSYYGYSTQTVSEVFENPWMTEISPRKVSSLWILNLNNSRLSKIKNNEIVYEAPISVSKINNMLQIKILDGLDTGLLIEMSGHQSVTWYYFYEDLVEYQKWIDFDIIKTY